jgi:TolA-binding protein
MKEKGERQADLSAQTASPPSAFGEGLSGTSAEAPRVDGPRTAVPSPVAEAASSPAAAKDAYAAAMELYTAGRYAEAERAFTDVAAAGNRNAPSASLYAAKSAEAGVGCSRAAAKYEWTASHYGATTPGAEALWAAANCYRAIGNFDKARQLYLALRSVAGYRDRAEGELASLAAQRQQQSAGRARAAARPTSGANAPPAGVVKPSP